MELNNTISSTNSISRSESYPLYKDYKALVEIGYDLIANFSGALWTNYNDSDPGITILQNFCYALTELGSKADLPLSDILADPSGNIAFDNHFHTQQQILPANPVTLRDFSKAVLDVAPEIKQVYIIGSSSFYGATIMQTNLEVKPEYCGKVFTDISFVPSLQRKVSTLFHQQGNLTQVFVMPNVLSPLLLRITGALNVSKNVPMEKTIAGIIYNVNNYLSPYPVYKSYQQLISNGRDSFELLEGPYLPGGHIEDLNIVSKREQITTDELGAVFLSVQGVDDVMLKGISKKTTPDVSASVSFYFDEAPFVSVDSFSATQILVNGRQVDGIDSNKVQYYLNQLIPVQQPSDLNDLLPKGEYHDIGNYYSIQHNFPAIYQLTGKGQSDPAYQGKIKQLKAYLVLLEQLMADYLEQLKNTTNLFSFESGRTDARLTSTTYFTQPLYDVPGIDRVLKGVNGYKNLHGDGTSRTDWEAYSEDGNNPYVQQLVSSATTTADDLSRKLRAMEHLLARCGKQYDHQPLQFINPRYGTDTIAEVEYLKQTLQNFPLLSANRSRTYFKTAGSASLVSGLELNLENELGLCAFYNGITEGIHQSLLHNEGLDIIYYDNSGAHIIYPEGAEAVEEEGDEKKKDWVEVLWNDEMLFSFAPSEPPPSSMNAVQAREYLDKYTRPLTALSTKHYGCVLIDCAKLAEFLRFRWILKTSDGTIVYTSNQLSVDRLSQQVSLIDSTLPLLIKSVDHGRNFEIGVITDVQWYSVCSGIATETEANAILAQLQQLRLTPSSDTFIVEIVGENSDNICSANLLFGKIITFFPAWVSLYQQSSYRDLLDRKLLALAPASSICSSIFIPVDTYQQLLIAYHVWIKGVDNFYNGNRPSREARIAAIDIVKLLNACWYA